MNVYVGVCMFFFVFKDKRNGYKIELSNTSSTWSWNNWIDTW